MTAAPPERAAVFIDFENLVCTVGSAMHGVTRQAMEMLCNRHGGASVRRAYADWGDPGFSKYQEDLALNGIELIHVFRFGSMRKNAADIRMTVDAMETLVTHPDVSTYVIVAADGDYSPLAQRLREYGKVVIAAGSKPSERLIAVCNAYVPWDSLLADLQPDLAMAPAPAAGGVAQVVTLPGSRGGGPDAGPKSSPSAKKRPAAVVALPAGKTKPSRALDASVRLLLQVLNSKGSAGEWVGAAGLKGQMLAIEPSFDHRNHAAKTFTDFLALPEVKAAVKTKAGSSGMQVQRPLRP